MALVHCSVGVVGVLLFRIPEHANQTEIKKDDQSTTPSLKKIKLKGTRMGREYETLASKLMLHSDYFKIKEKNNNPWSITTKCVSQTNIDFINGPRPEPT